MDQTENNIRDITEIIKKQRWRSAGHLVKKEDNRWCKRLLKWCPRNSKCNRKQHDKRWIDKIVEFAELKQRLAQSILS